MRLPVKRSPQSQDWDLISSQLRLTVIAVVFVNNHLPPKSLSNISASPLLHHYYPSLSKHQLWLKL